MRIRHNNDQPGRNDPKQQSAATNLGALPGLVALALSALEEFEASVNKIEMAVVASWIGYER